MKKCVQEKHSYESRIYTKKNLFSIAILASIFFSNSLHAEDKKKHWTLEEMCEADGVSCFTLGAKYRQGLDTQIDNKKAAKYFEKACDSNAGAACNNLGSMYAKGEGVLQDQFKAAELHEKACKLKVAIGCYNIGVSYYNGDGVRYSKAKSLYFFGIACDLKYEPGCKEYANISKE